MDNDAIAAIIHAYAERLDAGDLEGLAQLFARATLRRARRTSVYRGIAEVLEFYRGVVTLYDGQPCTKHVITNVAIESDAAAGTAASRSYFSVLQARPELPLQVILAGRCHDRFIRIDGVWHLSDRLITADLIGDLRFHVQRGSRP